jgi:hypothetical protein
VGLAQVDPALVLDELAGPPLPPMAARAWRVFGEVNSTRSSGMGGIGAITYTELAAYQAVTGERLTPLDVALVREADGAFLQFAMRRMAPKGEDGLDHTDEE